MTNETTAAQTLVERLEDLAGDPPYYAKASIIVEAAAEIARLTAANEALEKRLAAAERPDLFWVDADPDVGYIDLREAIEADLGWNANGGVACIREGKTLGTRYYASLPPADDSDSDDPWEFGFDNERDADTAITSERSRRAALSASDAPTSGGEG